MKAKSPEKQNKQKSAIAVSEPSLSGNLLFREVAKKLAVMEPGKSVSKTVAFDRLWKELRAGELRAGFFLGNHWIEIANSFWQAQESDRLRDLLHSEKGKTKVYAAEVAEQLVQALCARGSSPDPDQIRALLTRSRKGFEPEITLATWQNFLERNTLIDRPGQTSKSKSGNTQSERWRDVAQFVLAYCMAAGAPKSTDGKGKVKEAMLATLNRLKIDRTGWPGESSLRDLVDAGYKLSKEIEAIRETKPNL